MGNDIGPWGYSGAGALILAVAGFLLRRLASKTNLDVTRDRVTASDYERWEKQLDAALERESMLREELDRMYQRNRELTASCAALAGELESLRDELRRMRQKYDGMSPPYEN